MLTILAYLGAAWLERQHPPTPASAPATEFSGARAMDLLEEFLAEDVPHPVGSEENRRVKRRIQGWLDEQGIAHEEQGAWACREKWASCAYAENIIAQVPGQADGPFVAMMAHYDSVPSAPGAGDDMAGVVAILEAARAAKAVGGFRNPLLLIITDAEETGLQGAEAFFRHHPLAGHVGVLLNLEGSGTRGVSQVLRTSMPNAWYMNLFESSAAQPAGTSLANEIFKRMPNDTDFSVAMEAGVPGIDFAFAAERNHYHTPNDNAVNLDPRTIQHHGDNLFPLVLQLANADLDAQPPGQVVYNGSHGIWWQWPDAWSLWLLGLTAILLLASSLGTGNRPLHWLLAGALLPIVVIVAGGVLAHGAFALLKAINGSTVPWPAHLWPFRLVVLTATLLPALVLARWAATRISFQCLLVGGWWFLWLLSVVLVFFLSDAASVLLVTLVPAALLLALAASLPVHGGLRMALQLATLVPATSMLNVAGILEATQGYHLLMTIWPWIALYAVMAFAFARGGWLPPVTSAVALLLVLGLVAALSLPLYSSHRPQRLNVLYLQGPEASSAVVHLQAREHVPQAMLATADFVAEGDYRLPWVRDPLDYVASVEAASIPAPKLVVEGSTETESGREVRLRLASSRGAWRVRLYLPPEAGARSALVEGNEIAFAPDEEAEPGYTGLAFHGMQSRDVSLTLRLQSRDPVQALLVDSAMVLPPAAGQVRAARPATAVPVHSGDRSVVFTEVTF